MAGRPEIPIGGLGRVSYEYVGERVHARARTRDAGGVVRRLAFAGDTEEEAHAMLLARAAKLGFVPEGVTENTSLETLLTLWLKDRDESARVKPQSHRIYRDTVRWLTPMAGALVVSELRPARLKLLLSEIARTRSAGAAAHARTALKRALAMAVEDDVLPHNPMMSVRPMELNPKKVTALTVQLVNELREAVARREARVRPRAGALAASIPRWVIEIQLGSSLRISEVLALRHMDVDLGAGTISVTGTLIDDEDWHVVRQEELKNREQARIIELPAFALAQLAEARAACQTVPSRLPTAPAIPGRTPGWVHPRNVRRSLRDIRLDRELAAALEASGISPSLLKPHVLRKTASTLIAQVTGDLKESQALLGHADERTTRAAYAGEAYRRVGSASVLDKLLGKDAG